LAELLLLSPVEELPPLKEELPLEEFVDLPNRSPQMLLHQGLGDLPSVEKVLGVYPDLDLGVPEDPDLWDMDLATDQENQDRGRELDMEKV
jgi:hypothetical protein